MGHLMCLLGVLSTQLDVLSYLAVTPHSVWKLVRRDLHYFNLLSAHNSKYNLETLFFMDLCVCVYGISKS